MTIIRIREQPMAVDGTNATVSFNHGEEFLITISLPFSDDEEGRLEWYFEQHLEFPFTEQVKAREAATSITIYGEKLFNQVFADRQAFADYKAALQTGVTSLVFEIAGSPEFHRLHWEALKDPALPRAFALEAPLVRKNLIPQSLRATVRPSPTINILIVTARPGGGHDVGYRTISRPLVEALRNTNIPIHIDILRPGSYRALVEQLETVKDHLEGSTEHGGYYHVIHFDVHGAVLTYPQLQQGIETNRYLFQSRYGREVIPPYEGHKAFLFLSAEGDSHADPVEATELAKLLITHQIPIAILNACQSGKQIGASETSLGSRLIQAGLQIVLAMGYSVTVSAAKLLMRTLYTQLFSGQDFSTAVRRARLELYNSKSRQVYFNQTIDLEDWLLPVVYQNQVQRLAVRDFTSEERKAYYARQAMRYQPSEPIYGFVGRDLDILEIEQRLLAGAQEAQHNILLVRGMGGAGKTTLLHHLGRWWQTTHLIDQVFYFGYDERAWTRQQIIDVIARRLLGQEEYVEAFQPLSLDSQQALLVGRLRSTRHLIILDNLESITGVQFAIENTLPPDEQHVLHGFVADLADGKTLVLLGSRSGEEWLSMDAFESNIYDLRGLDPEAASTLADRILKRNGATQYRNDLDLRKLLKLLDGYPLALEVVLANLGRQTPGEVLMALQVGDIQLDAKSDSKQKTQSILQCIDYSYSNLSPDAQELLTCLAPFTSVVYLEPLPRYTELLQQQPALVSLPFDRWQEVLQAAVTWGVLSPIPDVPNFLRLQPVLPYFLRNRLHAVERVEIRCAIDTAFRLLYDDLSSAMIGLLDSEDPEEQQLGRGAARLEYENLITALNMALKDHVSIRRPYAALSFYLGIIDDTQKALSLSEFVLSHLRNYPKDEIVGQIREDLFLVLDNLGSSQFDLRQYAAAEKSYQEALQVASENTDLDFEEQEMTKANVLHQLGQVAREQRQWGKAKEHCERAFLTYQALKIYKPERAIQLSRAQVGTLNSLGLIAQRQDDWSRAEWCYEKALEISDEVKDYQLRAKIYHNLGVVARNQREWSKSEQYYEQALEIHARYRDYRSQAGTHHSLAMLALEQHQTNKAEQHLKSALPIYVALNDRHAQSLVYFQLGRLAVEQEQWLQAEQYFQHVLEISIAFDDVQQQAQAYQYLGIIANGRQRWGDAELYSHRALQIIDSLDDHKVQAYAYHTLAITASDQEHWSEAEQYAQKALEILTSLDDRLSQAATYNQLGLIAQSQQRWLQACDYFLQALEIYLIYEDDHNGSLVFANIARLWKASADVGILTAVSKKTGLTPDKVADRLGQVLAK